MQARLRHALVTGGAKRIGRAIASDLAKSGYAVSVHANGSLAEADALAACLNKNGGRAQVVGGDLFDGQAPQSILSQAASNFGPVDLLINNASVFADDTATEFDEATFNRHFDIHVKAPLRLSAALVGALPSGQSALIVNVIDQRVWALNPRFFSYTLSKSTLWTATQTLAQALAPHIRVNAIGPGPTLANDRQSEEDFERQSRAVLLGHGPDLDEFGRTIRYLADTPSITGQMIALDGGQHLAWETPDVADITE
ncbi:SDR family oxidoreductase [Pararhizobium haloflavum]|uniref:SDR family oxidoreductase n=1 Tax=Pararhizobium haloflavum TaxID=2037914 RepID=UPI000C1A5763|nr:SDR family oxidoreductase [Pararhizobium haloflavum]